MFLRPDFVLGDPPVMALREQLEQSLRGTYAIERELGGGGMSRVFLAEERSLGRKVVIKVLPPELSAGLNVERFEREIQLAAALQHPHIVPVFAAGDVDGIPYFTMPFVEGESLRDLLKRGELPVPEVVSILRDITKALSYAHAHGVVHRDIKPDNILLSAHAATVTDFGVAKALTQAANRGATLTEAGIALGTPAYMAPEQATADPNVDARADLYALGVIAYEMLIGQTPFAGRSAQQLLAAQVTEAPRNVSVERPSVPAGLSDLVGTLLAKRPADRPQSAEDVLHALDALGTPTAGLAPTAAVRGDAARRHWIPWTVGATTLAALGLLLVMKPWANRVAAEPTATQQATVEPPAAAAAAAKFRPTSVVVAPFTNMTGDTALNVYGAIAAQSLSDGLAHLDSLVVMSPSAGLLDSTGTLRRFAGADAVRALGREAKAASVAWGSFRRDGDSLRFQAEMIDVNDGRVQITLEPVRAPAKNANAAIDELRDRMISAIDASKLKGRLGSMGRPPNAAAYREFLSGLYEKWENPKGSNATALPYFEKASQLDTTFLMAAYYVVLVHSNLSIVTNRATRWLEFAAADSAYLAMKRRIVPTTDVERDLLEDARAIHAGDYEAGLRVEQRMQQRDSSLRMVQNVAFMALGANYPRAAIAAIQAWPVNKVPETWTGLMGSECEAEFILHDYESTIRCAKKWSRRSPKSTGLLAWQVRGQAALGHVAEVRRLIDSAIADYDWRGSPNAWGDAASVLRANGHPAEAMQLIDEGFAAYAAHPPPPAARNGRDSQRAFLFRMRGALDSSQAIYERLGQNDTLWAGARINAAISAALRHDTATVTRALAALDTMAQNKFDHGSAQVEQARIAAAFGDKAGAVAYLKAGLAAGARFTYTWLSSLEFESVRDYPPFKALLKPKDQ